MPANETNGAVQTANFRNLPDSVIFRLKPPVNITISGWLLIFLLLIFQTGNLLFSFSINFFSGFPFELSPPGSLVSPIDFTFFASSAKFLKFKNQMTPLEISF